LRPSALFNKLLLLIKKKKVLIELHIEFDRKEMNGVMEGQKSGAVRVQHQVEVEFLGEDGGRRERERD
jgi:hypothetical protein